jgi:surface antigen
MRSFIRAVIGSALLAGALSACSGVSPTQALDAEDREQLAAARANALENNKTGQATNWFNAKTGNRGTMVPTRTYKSGNGADCREFQQTTTVSGVTDLAYGASCRAPGGTWKIVSEPSRYRPRDDAYYHYGYGYRPDGPLGYPYFRYGHRF